MDFGLPDNVICATKMMALLVLSNGLGNNGIDIWKLSVEANRD